MPPLPPLGVLVHRCSKCGMAFLSRKDADRHVALEKCSGATVLTAECDIAGPGRPPNASGRRKRQRLTPEDPAAAATVTNIQGNQNAPTDRSTVNDHSVHIQHLTIVLAADAAADVAKAGSPMEGELIRKIILENPTLRHMLRTIENAPSAIFHLTKGSNGPQVLRNVKKVGRKACELGPKGEETTTGLIEYCKRTAVTMVTELQRAVDSVGEDSPLALREWAADVSRSLRQRVHGDVDYVSALQLYNAASSKFYKLPREYREAIACGVRDIERFIAESAAF